MFKSQFKLVLLIVWIGLCCIPAWGFRKCKKFVWRDKVTCICYLGILRIIGIHLHVSGQLSERRPLLLVSNHISYLDIPVLGSQAPFRFTPKSEVDNWPAIGWICRLCDAVFVDRKPEQVKNMSQLIRDALARNDVVSLFPEATTGNGMHLLPFKSGFFSLAEEPINGQELVVQPVAITYTRIRRLPIDLTQWPSIAWYGDMELAPHVRELLKLGPIDAELVFLPPVTLSQYGDRKNLTTHCHQAITEAIALKKASPEQSSPNARASFKAYFSRLKRR